MPFIIYYLHITILIQTLFLNSFQIIIRSVTCFIITMISLDISLISYWYGHLFQLISFHNDAFFLFSFCFQIFLCRGFDIEYYCHLLFDMAFCHYFIHWLLFHFLWFHLFIYFIIISLYYIIYIIIIILLLFIIIYIMLILFYLL